MNVARAGDYCPFCKATVISTTNPNQTKCIGKNPHFLINPDGPPVQGKGA